MNGMILQKRLKAATCCFIVCCLFVAAQTKVTVHFDSIVNNCYTGNGVQWDPYRLDYGRGEMKLSEADRQKLYGRLDFMRPQFIRVMTNTTSVIKNRKLVTTYNIDKLALILDYCQSRKVNVVFGDWGFGTVDARDGSINEEILSQAAAYLGYLVNERGYTCIRYYNLINEPNGYWSATGGNYQLWDKAVRFFTGALRREGLAGKISVMGPDIAIWKSTESWWIDSCATHGSHIGLYDIHTYPSKSTVNSGEYSEIIRAYKHAVPDGKPIVMGEIGLKFVEPADSLFQRENERRIKMKQHASSSDSQMFVYDSMYGTDMADALMQTVNEGFSGAVAWMLDDAMHSNEAPDKLKIWGFWNILGDEFFGSGEEQVRPWYYAWSLLTKYMPCGSKVYRVGVEGSASVKAVAVAKDGRTMIALVNVSKDRQNVSLCSSEPCMLKNMKEFCYAENALSIKGDHTLLPARTGLTIRFRPSYDLSLQGESLVVYTNFDY
jgi:hypothetical protein